jgi:hypothetical protein
MRTMGGPRVFSRMRNYFRLIAILTKLRRVSSTRQLISKKGRKLIWKVHLRRSRISSRRNSIGVRWQHTSNGLSTVRSTFAVIQRRGKKVTFKTLRRFLSKGLPMATSWLVSKMSLRKILISLTRSWATPMPLNNLLKSKITWMFSRLNNKRHHRSNWDVVSHKFRELRGKFKNKRVNSKVLVKLIECNTIRPNIDKVWTRWHKSRACNSQSSNFLSKVGLSGPRRLERIIREW